MKKHPSKHQITKHHIIPKSRVKGKGILGICKVERMLHELYHYLFGNMTPDEIVVWLNKTFWNSEYIVTIERREK